MHVNPNVVWGVAVAVLVALVITFLVLWLRVECVRSVTFAFARDSGADVEYTLDTNVGGLTMSFPDNERGGAAEVLFSIPSGAGVDTTDGGAAYVLLKAFSGTTLTGTVGLRVGAATDEADAKVLGVEHAGALTSTCRLMQLLTNQLHIHKAVVGGAGVASFNSACALSA